MSTWYSQTPLDLSFKYNAYDYQEMPLILIAFVIAFVLLLCLGVSCYIIQKYKKLSQKLTEAGSRVSNLDLVSGTSNVSMMSGGNSNLNYKTSSVTAKSSSSAFIIKGQPTGHLPTKYEPKQTQQSISSKNPKSFGFKVRE